MNETHRADLKDARYLLKEAASAKKQTRMKMLREARDIVNLVLKEEDRD